MEDENVKKAHVISLVITVPVILSMAGCRAGDRYSDTCPQEYSLQLSAMSTPTARHWQNLQLAKKSRSTRLGTTRVAVELGRSGSNGTGPNPVHVFNLGGHYTGTLTVTNPEVTTQLKRSPISM